MNSTSTTAFQEAARKYLSSAEGQFNYRIMLDSHLDSSRFFTWIDEISKYHSLSGAEVLSSGCGSAGNLLCFLQRGCAYACGVEVDTDLKTLADLRFESTEFRDRVEILTCDGDQTPYPGNRFDIVFSMHVIEHTWNPAIYLDDLCRVLRPEGILFLEVPYRWYPLEQHIDLPLIHRLPVGVRNHLVTLLTDSPIARFIREEIRFRVTGMRDFHLPSPGFIKRVIKKTRLRHGTRLVADELCNDGKTYRIVITKLP